MADVYKLSDNILMCFQSGLTYYGFLNGSENSLITEPVQVNDEVIDPGDRIVAFESGNNRTSFNLSRGYMEYKGRMAENLLFEIYDPKSPAKQQNLFDNRPLWLIAFAQISVTGGFLMFSSTSTSFDIHPKEIIRYKNPVSSIQHPATI